MACIGPESPMSVASFLRPWRQRLPSVRALVYSAADDASTVERCELVEREDFWGTTTHEESCSSPQQDMRVLGGTIIGLGRLSKPRTSHAVASVTRRSTRWAEPTADGVVAYGIWRQRSMGSPGRVTCSSRSPLLPRARPI